VKETMPSTNARSTGTRSGQVNEVDETNRSLEAINERQWTAKGCVSDSQSGRNDDFVLTAQTTGFRLTRKMHTA
jgi:hypothetical protein